MPKQSSIPSQTYATGVYGPFAVNNLDAADSVAYFRYGGGATWGAASAVITLEMRLGNGPWFLLCRSVEMWQGNFVNKYTGAIITEAEVVMSLPYVGEARRDLRATFEVQGASITSALAAGTR